MTGVQTCALPIYGAISANDKSSVNADPHVRTLVAASHGATTDQTTRDLNDYRWRAPTGIESRGARWGYAVASLFAVLLLIAQSAYFFRDELVSRLPQVAPLMAIACEHIGCRVEPPKRRIVGLRGC